MIKKETLEPSDGTILTNELLVFHVHSSDKLKNGNKEALEQTALTRSYYNKVFENLPLYFALSPPPTKSKTRKSTPVKKCVTNHLWDQNRAHK